ncbi:MULTISPECIES: hypothetical protein [unclassified Streptomyces]|uniref:hypothetical protein n=1 Tax=unclassified Streptomyces TaxID=2593676 RepID=UPI0033DE0D07
MNVILDVKFNEFAREYADSSRYAPDLYDMAQLAIDFGWRGFGMVDDGTGEPLTVWDVHNYYDCDCSENRIRVNCESALAAFKAAGVDTYSHKGWIVWDAASRAGHEIARKISAALADYPILDDERLSELEWDNACAMIADLYSLPEGIEPDDVIRQMPEVPSCSNCSRCDVDEALASLGYGQCMDCSAWVKTCVDPSEHVCYDCAEREQEGDCQCVPAYVDALRHMGLYPTVSDLREIQRGCEDCYPVRWPHGGAKLGI